MPKTRPRDALSVRSLSQLSTIIAAPAKQKPDNALSGIQTYGVRKISDSKTVMAAIEHITPKALMWPTFETRAGVLKHPAT
jgi:hypothetical protein